ncbi:MAG TPA: hypothetical protein VGC65_09335 [Bacteroidia bacterium]|jgi:hypothetical protein
MKKILSALLLLLCISCFGQEQIDYEVDSLFTVRIPKDYFVKDTLGTVVVSADVSQARILITTVPKTELTLFVRNPGELIGYYRGVQAGVINETNGKLVSETVEHVNKLKLWRFSYVAIIGEEQQLRDNLLLFLNGKTYCIQFVQLESMKEEKEWEREKLFASLRIYGNVRPEDQFIEVEGDKKSNAYNAGYKIGQSIGYLLIGITISGIIAGLIFWIVRRNIK